MFSILTTLKLSLLFKALYIISLWRISLRVIRSLILINCLHQVNRKRWLRVRKIAQRTKIGFENFTEQTLLIAFDN